MPRNRVWRRRRRLPEEPGQQTAARHLFFGEFVVEGVTSASSARATAMNAPPLRFYRGGTMQRSMTRIRTSHVGRLPPPKGWEDMPARLASAELTDPEDIAAKVDAGDCRNGEEAGRDRDRLHRRRRVLDRPQPRPLRRAFHRHRGAPGGPGRAADHPPLDPRARRIP